MNSSRTKESRRVAAGSCLNSSRTNESRRVAAGSCGTIIRTATVALLGAAVGYGQSPWETAVNNLQTSFTGPIAKGLSLIAIVIGGLTFAYSEGGSKKVFAGIVFGIGMALSAAAFLTWLFGA